MKKKTVNIVTMGCSKNLVDSEVLLRQLERSRWSVAHDADSGGFDAVIVNTCGFIHDAKQESIDMILDYAQAKSNGEIGKLYVMGCLSERYKNELKAEIPEVDRYFGKFDLQGIVAELNAAYFPEYIYERKITTPSHYAYLKISEGCNRRCAFCAIPGMTGNYKSRTVESLVRETQYLAGKGVKELLVIAQDLSWYGFDLYGKSMLAELIDKLSETEGIEWIRLHYFYPSQFPFEILKTMRENPKVCKYLDIPLQHIADGVLKNMKRKVTRAQTEQLICEIREAVPGVALRTTMLTGYPGETEKDFEALCRFVKETRFERLGVFPYSHEEGTYAFARFDDNIPEEIKQERAARLMEIQQQISLELNESKIGQTLRAITDRTEGTQYVGRTEFDSPEVDGEVLFTSKKKIAPGDFVNVKITGAEEFDLFGHTV